jgi:SagB-type dehydrogenase family enzyme
MPKLVWVALPLLAAAALLALQWLRRGAPSRHALNVWSSLLLLGYVATTAALGIFWVANQQLPVFDWHYLFGYATLLLLTLHLVFNFGAVWHYLRRNRGAAAGASGANGAAPGRRIALGSLGLLLGAGAAFVLGLRHGRSELRIEAPARRETGADSGAVTGNAAAGGPDSAAAALALVERFHAFSSHSRAGVLLRAPSVDWGDAPPPFKQIGATQRVPLPHPATVPGTRTEFATLAQLLWHTAGITATRAQIRLRASPSSGALFSTELYVAARDVAGLSPGLWHYDAQSHTLARLEQTLADPGAADAALGAQGNTVVRDAAATVIATAVFRRTGHKYRDRTYRYVLADLGHALENLRVAAGAGGAVAHFVARFDEAQVAATLRIDEREEGVLALVAMSFAPWRVVPAAPPRPHWADAHRWLPRAPVAEDASLGVTGAVHAATSLRAAAVSPPRAESAAAGAPAARPAPVALPAAAAASYDVFAVIAARRSIRRFATAPLALADLSGVLGAMAGHGVPQVLSAAVRVHVVANAVAGLVPGAYRYDAASHALQPHRAAGPPHTERALRAASQAAALDQDVIGDAAAVFVLTIDRETFSADPAGPARGYRHAFLEAGLIGERIYLEAGARGLGACAVGAFYDAQAAALIGVDPAREWPVHFAALGIPSE